MEYEKLSLVRTDLGRSSALHERVCCICRNSQTGESGAELNACRFLGMSARDENDTP